MEGSLVLGLSNRTGFLKEVRLDVGSGNVARSVEIDSDEFTLSEKRERIGIIELQVSLQQTYETGRVVVLDSLGIAESFQDRIGLKKLLLQFSLHFCKKIYRQSDE